VANPAGSLYFVVVDPAAPADASASVIGPYPNAATAKLLNLNAQIEGNTHGYPSYAAAKAFADSWNKVAKPTVGNPVAGALTGVDAIGDFFHRLSEANTWSRVGEVLLGGILVYAGVKALSSGTVASGAAKAATSPVKKAAKVAVPEARLASRVTAKKVAPKTTARVASHRTQVATYGQKKPYRPPAPRPTTKRVSHIYHHKAS
jgi:hypothetical protein